MFVFFHPHNVGRQEKKDELAVEVDGGDDLCGGLLATRLTYSRKKKIMLIESPFNAFVCVS